MMKNVGFRKVRRAVRRKPYLSIALGVGAVGFVGVSAYFLYRSIYTGDNVVLYLSEGSGSGEFRSSAERVASSIGATVYPVRNAQEILDAIRRHHRIKNLILLGHGSTTSFLRPGEAGIRVGSDALPTWMSTTTFAREAGPRMSRNSVIGWAGCSSASNPGEATWPRAYEPGGENSFIAHVRDDMAAVPGVSNTIENRGHSAPGHTTGNPGARTCYVSQPGQICTSEIDELWGPTAHETRTNEWVSAFQGQPAEAWISGANIVV